MLAQYLGSRELSQFQSHCCYLSAGYGMGVTFASLQSISNSPVLTRFLNISANGSSISFALSFRNVGCSPSGPGLFGSFCKFLISSILSWHEPYFLLLGKLISASDICLTSSVSTRGANLFYF